MMGCHANITADKFPRQGPWLGKRVDVCYHFDTSATFSGTVLRDDMEEPGIMIIGLDNGRVVLATECQHSTPRDHD